ncbi:CBS domain-containing protein [bacterium]|nr:CBS domain-containing protein [bacterium]
MLPSRQNSDRLKISASVYAHTEDEIDQTISNLEQIGVDYLHVDCNDDMAVFDEIEQMRRHSAKPIDLHIISPRPLEYLPLIARHKPEFVSLQYELLPADFSFPAIQGVSFGLAIATSTPVDVFAKYRQQVDFILVMATTPGQSGGKFDPQNFKKIRAFMRHFPEKKVTVDGGVNAEVSFVLRSYGVHTAVVGSYLAKSPNRAASLSLLKHENVESHYTVADMMVSRKHLPILSMAQCTMQKLLEINEEFRLGYTLVEDENQKLLGISTNADLRRGLLKKMGHFDELTVDDFINFSPKTINENTTISQMLDMIRKSEHFISYMPVLDDNQRLTGAINLHFLIKGEL